jgi:hypothetical protein
MESADELPDEPESDPGPNYKTPWLMQRKNFLIF